MGLGKGSGEQNPERGTVLMVGGSLVGSASIFFVIIHDMCRIVNSVLESHKIDF